MEIIRYVSKKDLKKCKDYDIYYKVSYLLKRSLSNFEYPFKIPIKIIIPDKEVL